MSLLVSDDQFPDVSAHDARARDVSAHVFETFKILEKQKTVNTKLKRPKYNFVLKEFHV